MKPPELILNPRLAVVEDAGRMWVAPIPDGPVTCIDGAAQVLLSEFAERALTAGDAVSACLAHFTDAPAGAAEALAGIISDLTDSTILLRHDKD